MVAQKSAQSVLAYRAATEVAGGDWLAGYAGGDGLIDVTLNAIAPCEPKDKKPHDLEPKLGANNLFR